MAESEFVYHYCTVETMKDILEQGTLRLSDIEKSNDYAERKWIQNMIDEEFFAKYPHNHRLFGTYQKCKKEFIESRNLYAACFSENPDLLSQWRAYAMDGRGVAIGFYKRYLKQLEEQNPNLHYLKICYDLKRHNRYACEKAEKMQCLLERRETLEHIVNMIFSEPEIDLGEMKNPAFSEEQEWRICMTAEPAVKQDSGCGPDVEASAGVYYKNYRLISYYDLKFFEEDTKPIGEIVLGPKCRMEIRDVKTCFNIWGYDSSSIEIRQSCATYC